jgi:hypothetical protein
VLHAALRIGGREGGREGGIVGENGSSSAVWGVKGRMEVEKEGWVGNE